MKIERLGWTLVVALSASASSQAATPSPLLAQAKRIIASEMVDPGSLQYRALRVVHSVVQGKPLTIACGEYNGKNKLGGYAGFAKFAYEPTTLHGVISEKADGDLDLFGDAGTSRADTETQARILAVCLGIKQ